MSESTTETDALEAEVDEALEATGTTETGAPEATGTEAADNGELEAVKAAKKKADREAQNLRKRLAEFEAKEKEREEADLTEREKAEKRATEAEAAATAADKRAQAASLKAEVAAQSVALNIVDVDAALALMNREGIEFDEAGAPTGVKEALAALVADKAYLVAKPGAPGTSPSNPKRGSGDVPVSDAEKLRAFRTGGSTAGWWKGPRS